jgi:hypothetical protein
MESLVISFFYQNTLFFQRFKIFTCIIRPQCLINVHKNFGDKKRIPSFSGLHWFLLFKVITKNHSRISVPRNMERKFV